MKYKKPSDIKPIPSLKKESMKGLFPDGKKQTNFLDRPGLFLKYLLRN